MTNFLVIFQIVSAFNESLTDRTFKVLERKNGSLMIKLNKTENGS